MKSIFGLFFILITISAQSQIIRRDTKDPLHKVDTTSFEKSKKVKLSDKTHYTDYKIISIKNDTTIIDTTLTIKKEYLFNFLRKDNFDLMPFHNQGQTFTRLGYQFKNLSLTPFLGANAKHFNYYKVNDIYYYRVPTPASEVMYHAGLEQGQVLDFLVTMNTSPQFNFSLAYKGMRSLGKYRNALSSHGNFRFSSIYLSKRKHYEAKFHYYLYDLMNQENGGITEDSKFLFEENEKNYRKRGRLEVNFTDATSLLKGSRIFLEHSYSFFKEKTPEKKKKSSKEKTSPKETLNLKKKDSKIKKLKTVKKSISKKDTDSKKIINRKKDTVKSKILKEKAISNKKIKDSISNEKKKIIKKSKNLKTVKKSISKKNTESKKIINRKKDTVKSKIHKEKAISNKKIKDSISNTKKKVTKKRRGSLWKNLDKFNVSVGHTFLYETKLYNFKQATQNKYFGKALKENIDDNATYNKLSNKLYLASILPFIGEIKGFTEFLNYNYFFNGMLHIDNKVIPNKLKGNALIVGGKWNAYFKKFNFQTEISKIVNSSITGNSLKIKAIYRKPFLYNLSGFIDITNKSPDLNKLLYQSTYKKYNWKKDFKNENIKIIGASFSSIWGAAHLDYTLIHNYTYFDTNSLPKQSGAPVGIIKLKVLNEFRWRKFRLANTLMYQQVTSGENIFRVPKLTTRNTLYFQDGIFKGDPLLLQVGVTFRYFTKYKMNEFNPLINEFYLQNNQEIGDYPVFDFFVNGRVRNARLFLKVENFTSSFTGRKYYSAPYHPYRDLVVRFGLVWNWFI